MNLMFAERLVEHINHYYGRETVYLCEVNYGKCYTTEGKNEIGQWGLQEWASAILNGKEIGDIKQYYRCE